MVNLMKSDRFECPVEREGAMAFVDGQVVPQIRVQLEQHCADCAPCGAVVEEMRQTRAICRTALKAVEPPPWLLARALERAHQSRRGKAGARRRLLLCLAVVALGVAVFAGAVLYNRPKSAPFTAVMQVFDSVRPANLDYKTEDCEAASGWLKQKGVTPLLTPSLLMKEGIKLKGVKVLRTPDGEFVVWDAAWSGQRIAGIQANANVDYPANVGASSFGDELGFSAMVDRRLILITRKLERDFFVVIENPDALKSELDDAYFHCR